MKKFFTFVSLALISTFAGIFISGCDMDNSARGRERVAQYNNLERAQAATPVPTITYYQERRTVSKWATRWDKPNVPCYVYLISFGNIIGYYVTDGKPASTQSYIIPEQELRKFNVYGGYERHLVDAPDIDGTYGKNNPGIRFFTAEGVAVEWAGDGASYLYSDAPLPIKVPCFNRQSPNRVPNS